MGPGVFVPRPETEVMTGWAVDRLREMAERGIQPLAVDLGTGSGAVAKALATEVPQAQVHAVEISEDALLWAGRNLENTGVTLHAADLSYALPELNGDGRSGDRQPALHPARGLRLCGTGGSRS